MSVKHLAVTIVAITLGMCTLTLHADNNASARNRMPHQPSSTYWQAPNWSNFSESPASRSSRPVYNPPAAPAYNQPYQRPAPPAYRSRANRPELNRAAPALPNVTRGNQPPPPPPGPYRAAPDMAAPYGRDNNASAFNTPGFKPYRSNRRSKNKFWGRSGPGTWMNPNKGGMERGWDDMINSPSRMGTMPGGWTAPEVTMPNPIDIGDQIQENIEDLPEQVKDMDVGN